MFEQIDKLSEKLDTDSAGQITVNMQGEVFSTNKLYWPKQIMVYQTAKEVGSGYIEQKKENTISFHSCMGPCPHSKGIMASVRWCDQFD